MKLFMKIALFALLFVTPILGYGQSKTAFTDELMISEGKAIVYIYRAPREPWPVPLVFTKQGLIGVLPEASYYSFVIDPGIVKFWFACNVSKEFSFEAFKGKIYYIRVGCKVNISGQAYNELYIELVKAERAKTDREILKCSNLNN